MFYRNMPFFTNKKIVSKIRQKVWSKITHNYYADFVPVLTFVRGTNLVVSFRITAR